MQNELTDVRCADGKDWLNLFDGRMISSPTMSYTNLHGAREPKPTNDSDNEIPQSLHGYCEQGSVYL